MWKRESRGYGGWCVPSLAKAGDCVEGALLPVRAFALQVRDVQLAAQPAHDLLGEQVVHQGRLHAAIFFAQLNN